MTAPTTPAANRSEIDQPKCGMWVIEIFYNRQRRHSTLGMISPAEFERRYAKQQAAA